MDCAGLIKKIESSLKIEDVLDVRNFKSEFNSIMLQIHPDKCNLSGASDATFKMNEWKSVYENGKIYTDDAGQFKTNGYWTEFQNDSQNLDWSVENYRLFQQLKSDSDIHFLKYLPFECKLQSNNKYRFVFDKRSISLYGLQLGQEHVNWVFNRLLEYCAYLEQINFVHCGLIPESVFIVPETHGLQIISWYHLTRIGNKIKTISGKYQSWYPSEVFGKKLAISNIDLELCKRIAVYLLGEKSGNAVKLRKTHNADFVNFLLSSHTDAYQCLTEYKDLLARNFKKEFHLLTI